MMMKIMIGEGVDVQLNSVYSENYINLYNEYNSLQFNNCGKFKFSKENYACGDNVVINFDVNDDIIENLEINIIGCFIAKVSAMILMNNLNNLNIYDIKDFLEFKFLSEEINDDFYFFKLLQRDIENRVNCAMMCVRCMVDGVTFILNGKS